MKNTIYLLLFTALASCQEIEVEKKVLPNVHVAGEWVVDLELTQPFAASDHQVIRIYNTANSSDSLWVEDADFFESKVRVKWDGANGFSAEGAEDILHGEIVNISGQVFPDKDSIHVEWRYLQGGDPADDYVVVANGVLYNGLTN